MTDSTLLTAISDMMDTKLKPVNDRLDKIERTQKEDILPRLSNLEASQQKTEQAVKRLEVSQQKTEQAVKRLEESQQKTEQAVKRLEVSQQKTEQAVKRLEASQQKTEQAVKRLEVSQQKTDQAVKRLEKSQQKTDQAVQRLEKSQQKTDQAVKRIELTLENNVLPRLQTIESCYLSTFERYQSNADKIEIMQSDIDIIKKTVMKHSEKIQKLA